MRTDLVATFSAFLALRSRGGAFEASLAPLKIVRSTLQRGEEERERETWLPQERDA